MGMKKRMIPLCLASLLAAANPLTALAASPEFARSAEEWASLADDVLEYEEIAGLIHEYNATVQKNAIDYNEFRKEYGDTNDEVADKYRELADDLRTAIDYPDVDDSSYASTMSQILTNEVSADTYDELADDALEDSHVMYLTYAQEEAELVSEAQTEMVDYYSNQIQLEIDKMSRELAEEAYQYTLVKRNVGSATETELLSARETVRAMDQAIIDDESAIESGRKRLIVMLGWSSQDTPEIRELPETDLNRAAQLDPSADLETAIANNYTLLINERELENAQSTDKRDSLETSVAENRRTIGSSLNTCYQSVLSAQLAYELAVSEAELEDQNLIIAQTQAAAGSLDSYSLKTQQYTTETAHLSAELARLTLFQALQDYDWAVNGLASAS